jgi:hypothetical protein
VASGVALGAALIHAVEADGFGRLIRWFGRACGQQRTGQAPGCEDATIAFHLERLSK